VARQITKGQLVPFSETVGRPRFFCPITYGRGQVKCVKFALLVGFAQEVCDRNLGS